MAARTFARALLGHRIEGQRLHLRHRPDARADVEKWFSKNSNAVDF
jgi:hypothetical protein